MMLREQLWSVSPGTLSRSVCGCSGCGGGHGFPGITRSRERALLLNYCSSGQPEPRQKNGSTFLHKVAGSSLTHLSREQGQQGRERIGIADGSGTLCVGTNIVKPLFALKDLFSVCICISFLPAHFQALFYLYPHLLGSRKLLYLDLSIMIFSIWVDLCNFPSAGNSSCNSQNFCVMAFCCKERSKGLLQTVAKHSLQ